MTYPVELYSFVQGYDPSVAFGVIYFALSLKLYPFLFPWLCSYSSRFYWDKPEALPCCTALSLPSSPFATYFHPGYCHCLPADTLFSRLPLLWSVMNRFTILISWSLCSIKKKRKKERKKSVCRKSYEHWSCRESAAPSLNYVCKLLSAVTDFLFVGNFCDIVIELKLGHLPCTQ